MQVRNSTECKRDRNKHLTPKVEGCDERHLTTSIAVLLSVENGALIFLLGAQVIAEYERIGYEPIIAVPQPMRTEAPRQ